ncbi:MAG TPA: class I SAM-dependent methyltransferase [Bryobacteraceae bacterium]|nr:class I SAM-dependent methyltransferase [Bryobacteraceae bacterium]
MSVHAETKSAACLVCGGRSLSLFLDLGATALANKFLSSEELACPEPTYPLRVAFCPDCTHVQLLDRVPPAAMFANYLYVSSASETLKRHFDELSALLIEREKPGHGDLVVDIGCNDGTLLAAFRRNAPEGVRTLGVDPAENLEGFTRDLGIERYTGLFTSDSARKIRERWGEAAVITATNTFPHIQDLHDFAAGITELLAPNGVFVIEAHYLPDLLKQTAFDTVYHEHVSYWALRPMMRLFEQHGLRVMDAERLPIHHGQLRVYVKRQGQGEPSPNVAALLDRESAEGLDRLETYRAFAQKVERLKTELLGKLAELQAQGKSVVGYGAPAKGTTLLNYLELGPANLAYIVDKSRLKQGLFVPGVRIPVVPTERLLEDRPDFVLLLAWNFQEEIIEQQVEYRKLGGRFITPVPEVRVV